MPATVLNTNYAIEHVFLGCNHYEKRTYTNSSGSSKTLVPGLLMGEVLATGKVLPHISSATDGSEMPTGFCAGTYTVADGATVTIDIVTKGEVNQNAITLGSGDTLTTAVRTVSTGGGTIRSLIERNTHCVLIPSTELSRVDPNQ